jgi:hypothetical protein
MKRYKLLKDLPDVSAGTVAEADPNGVVRLAYKMDGVDCFMYFNEEWRDKHSGWLRDVDDLQMEEVQEREKSEAIAGEKHLCAQGAATEGDAMQPTIIELLAILEQTRTGSFQIERNIRDRAHALLAQRIGAVMPINPEYSLGDREKNRIKKAIDKKFI